MTAAGHHDQSLVLDIDHQSLVIENERVVHPSIPQSGLLNRKARLIAAGPGHLSGHQQGVCEQEAGLAVLDDLEAGAFQGGAAGGRDF
jgi:hypothetical protein